MQDCVVNTETIISEKKYLHHFREKLQMLVISSGKCKVPLLNFSDLTNAIFFKSNSTRGKAPLHTNKYQSNKLYA